jgi:hypothetical protein
MTDVVIASVKEFDTPDTYWNVIDMSGAVIGVWGELADAESYCNDTDLTYEIIPVRKYTANLLSANVTLKLSVIEDHKLSRTFDMTGDYEKARQGIRDYCNKNRIRVLNRASFNWSL